LVAEHAAQVLKHLQATECLNLPSPHYMQRQYDINEKMRAILVDWIIEVHLKFKLLPETLFLAVNLMDRFLEKVQIGRHNLQLVGVTAMLIASKFEEIYSPTIKDFVYITDDAYTKQNIFDMEEQMLRVLEFNIAVPTPYRFLERFAKVEGANSVMFNLARYLIELPLIEQRMLKYQPSLLAASALYLARKVFFGDQAGWTQTLQETTLHTVESMRSCAKDMLIMLKGI